MKAILILLLATCLLVEAQQKKEVDQEGDKITIKARNQKQNQ